MPTAVGSSATCTTGVQQHLVALAVNLQRASGLVDDDPAAANALLEQMGHDVQQALDETAQLAQRIYPPLLEAGGLAAALRSAAIEGRDLRLRRGRSRRELPARVRGRRSTCAASRRSSAPARERGRRSRCVTRTERSPSSSSRTAPALSAGPDRLRDRVEALGGRLTIRPEPGRGTRVSGSLPLAR